MDSTVIKVEGLYKKFCNSLKRSMLYGTADTLRSMAAIKYEQGKLRKNEFWALENINFELRKGDTLGIIGVNGSGKSTLLRLLNGIYPPDKGKITVNGKIGALIAVGAGFHPHMTGRENVYLNGIILGMSQHEINKIFDSIVGFAEIGEFIDAPVGTYSSGMRVRLGFSIAMHSNPDILLIDEILSVGDLSFRNKSLRYMAEFRSRANAIIFISHQREQIQMLCNRVIVLNKGNLVFDGDTYEGLGFYEELTINQRVNSLGEKMKFQTTISDGDIIKIANIGICSNNNIELNEIEMNESLILFCDLDINAETNLRISFGVLDENRVHCIWLVNTDLDENPIKLPIGKHRIKTIIKEHHLMPGVYLQNLSVRNIDTGETYGKAVSNKPFSIKSNIKMLERGIVNVKGVWETEKKV